MKKENDVQSVLISGMSNIEFVSCLLIIDRKFAVLKVNNVDKLFSKMINGIVLAYAFHMCVGYDKTKQTPSNKI